MFRLKTFLPLLRCNRSQKSPGRQNSLDGRRTNPHNHYQGQCHRRSQRSAGRRKQRQIALAARCSAVSRRRNFRVPAARGRADVLCALRRRHDIRAARRCRLPAGRVTQPAAIAIVSCTMFASDPAGCTRAASWWSHLGSGAWCDIKAQGGIRPWPTPPPCRWHQVDAGSAPAARLVMITFIESQIRRPDPARPAATRSARYVRSTRLRDGREAHPDAAGLRDLATCGGMWSHWMSRPSVIARATIGRVRAAGRPGNAARASARGRSPSRPSSCCGRRKPRPRESSLGPQRDSRADVAHRPRPEPTRRSNRRWMPTRRTRRIRHRINLQQLRGLGRPDEGQGVDKVLSTNRANLARALLQKASLHELGLRRAPRPCPSATRVAGATARIPAAAPRSRS